MYFYPVGATCYYTLDKLVQCYGNVSYVSVNLSEHVVVIIIGILGVYESCVYWIKCLTVHLRDSGISNLDVTYEIFCVFANMKMA